METEFIFTLPEESMDALYKMMQDVNVEETVSFEIVDKYGHRAVYIRETEPDRFKQLRKIALDLLKKYSGEKEKQMAAVRLSAVSAKERDAARMLQAKQKREIEAYRHAIDDVCGE